MKTTSFFAAVLLAALFAIPCSDDGSNRTSLEDPLSRE